MGAFDKSFSDIDNTRDGSVYVVDDNGWGWFFLAIIVSLPFFLFSFFLKQISSYICRHPVISMLIYLLFAIVISSAINRKTYVKHRSLAFGGILLMMMPMAYLQGVYCIPYISASDSVFILTLEWIFSTGIMLGITAFLIALTNLSRNGFVRLFIGALFLIISLYLIHPPSGLTWEYISRLYSTAG